jgi:hypothetical protein
MTVAGGAASAKAFNNWYTNRKAAKSAGSGRCRRSVEDHLEIFDSNLPKLNQNLRESLPGSFESFNGANLTTTSMLQPGQSQLSNL